MTEEMNAILQLVKNFITGEKSSNIEYETLNWSEMFSIACRNNIAPFLFEQVIRIDEMIHLDKVVIQQWKQCTMQTSLMEYRKSYALRKILNKTKEVNYSPIIFKGPVLANLYPNYALRGSCDTDFLIKKEEEQKLITIIEELGYQRNLDIEGNVYTFESKEYMHKLELHTSLYAEHSGPRIDLLNTMDLASTNSLIKVDVCGSSIRTLGYEEQLIYLMFHLFKHFILEGIILRNLIDIILYINNYINKISLNKFWRSMDVLGYLSCCEVFFSIGIRYMGLDTRIMNNRKLNEDKICDDLLVDIFNYGLYKGKNRQTYQLSGIMESYMVGNDIRIRENPKKKMYRNLFMPISDNYNYAKKNKILIPICWIHKLGRYICSKWRPYDGMYSPWEKIKVAESRINLLQEVGLIEKVTEIKND